MNKLTTIAAGIAMSAMLPALAQAANGFATANVNLRAGPSTQYPAVTVIPVGARVDIGGCIRGANWCDVNFRGIRGWVSASYLQASYNQRRVYVGPQYYSTLGIPNVTFSIGNYWDRNYRGRDFYRDRDRWEHRDHDMRDGDRRDDHHRVESDDRRDDYRRVENDDRRDDRKRAERHDDRQDQGHQKDKGHQSDKGKHKDQGKPKKWQCPPGSQTCAPPTR